MFAVCISIKAESIETPFLMVRIIFKHTTWTYDFLLKKYAPC